MRDIAGLISKAAEKTGFQREFFELNNIPTEPSNIMVVTFFGDIRSLFVLSSLLLHRFKEQDKPSKYIILCSWPGFSCFFPYMDEYWSIQNEAHVKKLYASASGFINKNEIINQYHRNLNQYFFEDLVSLDTQFEAYYNNGLTTEFWNKYKRVKVFLPSVPSAISTGRDFNREFVEKGGYKVLVYPITNIMSWHNNQPRSISVPKDFWTALITRLLKERFVPVVCKNALTYDLSSDFSGKCIYFSETDMSKVLSVMRMTGCVLDVFSGISRYALAARTPFVCVDERSRYIGLKEYEIDDLCCLNVPKKYIFSFSTIIEGGAAASWDFDIFNSIIAKLRDFLPSIDKEKLPTTGQSLEFVSYDLVRDRKLNRIGTRLLKMPRESWEEKM
jgi:hypothetical protein